jgi:hypothetical protein
MNPIAYTPGIDRAVSTRDPPAPSERAYARAEVAMERWRPDKVVTK